MDAEAVLMCDVLADGTVAATVLLEPVYDQSTGLRVGQRIVDPATGAPYTAQGTIQQCPANSTCPDCQIIPLCDTVPVTTSTVELTATGYQVRADQVISGAPRRGTDADATAIWAGQTVSVPGAAPGGSDAGAHTHYGVILSAGDVACGDLDPAGTIDITATVTYRNDGPGGGWDYYGRLSMWNGTALLPGVDNFGQGSGAFFTPGSTRTTTITNTVPVASLLAGDVTIEFDLETGADPLDGTPAGDQPKTWTVTGGTITAGPAPVTGCPGTATPFLRHLCRSCDGTVTTTDTELDGVTAYVVAGTVGECPAETQRDCASPTEPTATVGLCLADGTPIAVTVVRDCAGTVTSEGWLNLTTGAYSAGAPPAGTVACGDSRSIQVSGTFCDVDPATGDVLGLVLIEYTYDDTGAIASVRLVDATTGGTYTPTGTITTCPAGVEQPEQDAVILCDTAADGTVTSFLRDFRRDENGAIVGHSDYHLDGTAYAPTGTVGVCSSPCLNCETVQLCDVTPGPGEWARVQGQATPETLANGITVTWTRNIPAGGVYPDTNMRSWLPTAATLTSTLSTSKPAQVRIGVSLLHDQTLTLPPGAEVQSLSSHHTYDPATRVLTADATSTMSGDTSGGANAGDFITHIYLPRVANSVDFTATVPGGAVGFDNIEAAPAEPYPFLRTVCRGCDGTVTSTTDTELDGTTPYTVLGTPDVCSSPRPDCEVLQLCDVQQDVSAVLPSLGTPDEQWQTLPNDVRWMKRGADTASGGGWYLAAANTPERFDFDRPVSIGYTVRFSGPTAAPLRIPAGWYLDSINTIQHAWDAATRTISPTASATQAGESTFRIDAQTAQAMIAPVIVGAQPSGQTSQYGQISVSADQVTPFLRTLCQGDGTVTTTDTALDGVTPYTVTGTAGTCPEAPASSCMDCETLVLCDGGADDPATITGQGVSSGTLANGVTWTMRGSAAPIPSKVNNADGAWFGQPESFPNSTIPPYTVTVDRPSTIEFSVYMLYRANWPEPDDNCMQLPPGVEVVSLPPGFAFDPITSRVCATAGQTGDPCANLTNPTRAVAARFRTTGPVSSLTTRFLGVRYAMCGQFQSAWVGAFEVTPAGQFLRTVCRSCDGMVTSVRDTGLDGVTPYTPLGAVGQCTQTPPCDKTVMGECVYSLPDTSVGFDLANAAFPDCWLGTATNPTYSYGDRATSWEGTYLSSTGTVSGLGFNSPDLGGDINFAAFTPAIPADPAESAAGYVGTAIIAGVTVTLRALAGNGLSLSSNTTKLILDSGDRVRVEFSTPVRLTVTTSAFADPPTPHNERLCGVVASTVPWQAVKLADCEGVITTVDATTRQPLPATATVQCNDNCCQPVQVCIQQDPVQSVEFISNEEHRNDNSVDPVWKWTTDLNAANPPWYDMYQYQFSAAWSVTDSDTERPAWWVSPHPNGASAQSSPARPNEGPSLLNTHWFPRAYFDLPDNADPATIQIQATVFNADQIGRAFRLNNGGWQPLPATATHNGTTYTFGPATIPGAQAGRNFLYLDVEETVGGGSGLMVHLKVTYEVIPETRSWTRMICCDDSVYYLDEDGQRQDAIPDGWHLAPCAGEAGSSTTSCAKQVVERCGCDDTDGDGIGDVQYTELWAVDPCDGAAPTLLGTYLDGDLTKPYTPAAPVECTTADALPGPVLTGVRNVTGVANQQLGAEFPGLQSVTLTVLSGFVAVTMSNGANVTIPAGVTMTWSVAKDDDTALDRATFVGTTAAANYLLNWTYR
jgi:hypothetical protein